MHRLNLVDSFHRVVFIFVTAFVRAAGSPRGERIVGHVTLITDSKWEFVWGVLGCDDRYAREINEYTAARLSLP